MLRWDRCWLGMRRGKRKETSETARIVDNAWFVCATPATQTLHYTTYHQYTVCAQDLLLNHDSCRLRLSAFHSDLMRSYHKTRCDGVKREFGAITVYWQKWFLCSCESPGQKCCWRNWCAESWKASWCGKSHGMAWYDQSPCWIASKSDQSCSFHNNPIHYQLVFETK